MVTKVLVFSPTFNEVENVENLVLEIQNSFSDLSILIVDDSSTDGTTNLLKRLSNQIKNLQVIVRAEKSGIGSAHMLAIGKALEDGYDLLITLDADLSHDPRDIVRFIETSRTSNYVVGTRSRGGTTELTGFRRALSKGANLLCRVLLPSGLSEYTTAYRCYDRSAMRVLIDKNPKDEGYSFFIEATEILYRSGLVLGEIPIRFRNRTKGKSKIPSLQVFQSSVKIWMLFLSRIRWNLVGGKS
jgi:dolichol-phosphate mannosyltransferase